MELKRYKDKYFENHFVEVLDVNEDEVIIYYNPDSEDEEAKHSEQFPRYVLDTFYDEVVSD